MSRRNQDHSQKVTRRARNKARGDAVHARVRARPVRDIPTGITSVSFEARGGAKLDLVLLPGAVPFGTTPPVENIQEREQEALKELARTPKGDA
jgi:hypothetical protein